MSTRQHLNWESTPATAKCVADWHFLCVREVLWIYICCYVDVWDFKPVHYLFRGPRGGGPALRHRGPCICEVCLAATLSGSIYRAARWEKWQVGSDERGWSVTLVNVKLQSNSHSRETLTQISALSQSSGSVCQDKVFLSLHSMFISSSVHLSLLSSAWTAFSVFFFFL